MTPTKTQRKMTLSLILVFTLFGVTLSYATTEDGYKNDTNPLSNISESTHTESGYKANIVINPLITGAYKSENNFKLDLAINPNGVGNALTENNFKLDLIPQKSFLDQHDLKVTSIVLSRTIVGKGYNVLITVTISNLELNYETLNYTINANTNTIKTQIITIKSRETTAVTFKWNTADFAYGFYTISATAHPVPGEAFTWDNTLTNGVVMVTLPGNIDGDNDVDYDDFLAFAAAYLKSSGQPGYHPVADIDGDGDVDYDDFLAFAAYYLKSL